MSDQKWYRGTFWVDGEAWAEVVFYAVDDQSAIIWAKGWVCGARDYANQPHEEIHCEIETEGDYSLTVRFRPDNREPVFNP